MKEGQALGLVHGRESDRGEIDVHLLGHRNDARIGELLRGHPFQRAARSHDRRIETEQVGGVAEIDVEDLLLGRRAEGAVALDHQELARAQGNRVADLVAAAALDAVEVLADGRAGGDVEREDPVVERGLGAVVVGNVGIVERTLDEGVDRAILVGDGLEAAVGPALRHTAGNASVPTSTPKPFEPSGTNRSMRTPSASKW